jgi:hypothetical protein
MIGCGSNDGDDPSGEGELDAKAISEIEALADNAVSAGIPGVSLAVLRGKQTITMARGVWRARGRDWLQVVRANRQSPQLSMTLHQ